MNKLILGDIVHYTNYGGEDGAPSDLKPLVITQPHPLAQPPVQIPDKPQVLPAMIVGVNNYDTGDVCLRVWYASSAVVVKNCLPSNASGGSHEAKGRWTPRDRELFDWDTAANRVDGLTVDQRDKDARRERKEFKDLPTQGLGPGEPDPKDFASQDPDGSHPNGNPESTRGNATQTNIK